MSEQEITYLYELLHTSQPKTDMPDVDQANPLYSDLVITINQLREAVVNLSLGNLAKPINGSGYVLGCLKNLQALLRNLTYTSDRLAEGDFSQQVDFLGDFSTSFNAMTESLKALFDDLKKTQEQLRESESRHRLLADHADDVIWTMDLEGKFTYVSPSVYKLRGYTVEEVMNQSQEEVLCPESLIEMQQGLKNAIELVTKGLPFKTYRGELEQPCKDGTTVWTDVTVSGIYEKNGDFIGMLGVTRDITERRKMEDEIRRLSITDKLTQSYNRLMLDESIDTVFADAQSQGSFFSVIILDIDHFKQVNDNFGHQAGDQVLIKLVKRLQKEVRDTDIVGRWGGEEFLIILPNTANLEAISLAERLRKSIAQMRFEGVGQVTISLGVASYLNDQTPEQMISRADAALYLAKQKGRNRVEWE